MFVASYNGNCYQKFIIVRSTQLSSVRDVLRSILMLSTAIAIMVVAVQLILWYGI